MYKLTMDDIQYIRKRGNHPDKVMMQLEMLEKGAPFAAIYDHATVGNGIKRFNVEEEKRFRSIFEKVKNDGRITKFVPASGAATRMFKDLISFYNSEKDNTVTPDRKVLNSVYETMTNIQNFPFYAELKDKLNRSGIDTELLLKNEDYNILLKYLLFSDGLNYSELPKAFLKFTKYDDQSLTAFEEHIDEGVRLYKSRNNAVNIHFTLSEQFIEQAKKLSEKISSENSDVDLSVSFSVQKPETDTIALYDETGDPVRDRNGKIVFRPAGHGALIENLNELDADIVLIKNIDNIMHKDHMNASDKYSSLLVGYLAELQAQIFKFNEVLDSAIQEDLNPVLSFLEDNFCINIDKIIQNDGKNKIRSILRSILNRPVRVCGMIRNTGEPGGGPFFVRSSQVSPLQIVESSQIDTSNKTYNRIFNRSTHFNPVIISCGLKSMDGKSFELSEFIDHESYFISSKSYNGNNIKALELPGLWNGAMGGWLTSFVELPLEVFCPVKKVNDLLRKERFSTK